MKKFDGRPEACVPAGDAPTLPKHLPLPMWQMDTQPDLCCAARVEYKNLPAQGPFLRNCPVYPSGGSVRRFNLA